MAFDVTEYHVLSLPLSQFPLKSQRTLNSFAKVLQTFDFSQIHCLSPLSAVFKIFFMEIVCKFMSV